jgi:hypothetical protein
MTYLVIDKAIILSLVYLFIVVLISLLHLFVLWYVVSTVLHTLLVIKSVKKGWGYFRAVKESLNYQLFFHLRKKRIVLVAMIFFVLSLAVYVDQRLTWMTSESKHLEAKEYFVVGESLNTYRQLLGGVFDPDSIVFVPLDPLQKMIYHSGIKHLPKNDAEDALWYGEWFVKMYSKSMYTPIIFHKKLEDRTTKKWLFLDAMFPHLEKLSTHTIQDPLMYKRYLVAFPSMVSYYAYYQSRSRILFGYKQIIMAGRFPAYDPQTEMVNQILFDGLMRHKQQWKEAREERWGPSPSDPKAWQGWNKKVDMVSNMAYEVPMHTAMLKITEILFSFHLEKEHYYTCEEPFIKAYSDARNRLFGMNGEGIRQYVSDNLRGNIDFMWGGGSISKQFIAEKVCEFPTSAFKVAMISKEFAYKSGLKHEKYYRLMRIYEKQGVRPEAVKLLKKYVEVLKRSEAYRKKFDKVDQELKDKEY